MASEGRYFVLLSHSFLLTSIPEESSMKEEEALESVSRSVRSSHAACTDEPACIEMVLQIGQVRLGQVAAPVDDDVVVVRVR